MRTLLCFLFCSTLLSTGESGWHVDFEKGGLESWHVPLPADWELAVEDGNHFLRLAEEGPIGDPRRPVKFALWEPGCVSDFQAQVKMRRGGKSLLVAFGFQDRGHFYYAHVSRDDGDSRVHNGVFKVSGGKRYRIGGMGAKPVLPTTDWRTVRVARKTGPGSIHVYINGEDQARFHVVDTSFSYGWVGVGSFDETGDFDDFQLRGTPSRKCDPSSISPLDSG